MDRNISDYTLPVGFGIAWFVFWGWLFLLTGNWFGFFRNLSVFPMAGAIFYLWLKAVWIDFVRIKRGDIVPFPGFVFWLYGLNLFSLWVIYDLMQNNIVLRLSDKPTVIADFWYRDYLWLLWVVLDLLSWFVMSFFYKKKVLSRSKKVFGYNLLIDSLRMNIFFVIFVLFDQFITWLSI